VSPVDDAATARHESIRVLDRILGLSTRDESIRIPLEALRNQARNLREHLESSDLGVLPAEAEEIARGEHPLCALLRVVAGIDTLDDAEWAALHLKMSEAFGRPIAAAAARGKLKVETVES
jgi:hypothetical protein